MAMKTDDRSRKRANAAEQGNGRSRRGLCERGMDGGDEERERARARISNSQVRVDVESIYAGGVRLAATRARLRRDASSA